MKLLVSSKISGGKLSFPTDSPPLTSGVPSRFSSPTTTTLSPPSPNPCQKEDESSPNSSLDMKLLPKVVSSDGSPSQPQEESNSNLRVPHLVSPSKIQGAGVTDDNYSFFEETLAESVDVNQLDTTPPSSGGSIKRKVIIFLFINPSSGGNRASAFTRAGVSHLSLVQPLRCDIYIHDIRDGKTGEKPGFLLLKKTLEDIEKKNHNDNNKQKMESSSLLLNSSLATSRQGLLHMPPPSPPMPLQRDGTVIQDLSDDMIRVLVAGGDGTIMWCAAELWAHQIDDSKVAIGVIPYGTGNDFAKAFGWKKYESCKPFDATISTLRSLIRQWSEAAIVPHDLWEVQIDAEDGFCKIDSKSRRKKAVMEGDRKVLRMTFIMSNYFSIGVESRIGIGFDRHRTTSQICNKLRYILEGLKKSTVKRNRRINNVISCLKENHDRLIFTTDRNDDAPLLKPAMSLILVNIPSFGAGNNIWLPSKRLGVVPRDQPGMTDVLSKPQIVGDSLLEVVTFPTTASLGMEFALKGQGSRVYQGAGPFQIVFKPTLTSNDRVYFQIDGEFFHMQKPKLTTVKLSRKIYVLRRQC